MVFSWEVFDWFVHTLNIAFFHKVLLQESPFPTGKLHYKVRADPRPAVAFINLAGMKQPLRWGHRYWRFIFHWKSSPSPFNAVTTSEILATALAPCKLDSLLGAQFPCFVLGSVPLGPNFTPVSPPYLVIGNIWETTGILVKLRQIKWAVRHNSAGFWVRT